MSADCTVGQNTSFLKSLNSVSCYGATALGRNSCCSSSEGCAGCNSASAFLPFFLRCVPSEVGPAKRGRQAAASPPQTPARYRIWLWTDGAARALALLAGFLRRLARCEKNEHTYYLANGADRPVTPESFATQEFGRRGRRLATDKAKQHQSVQSVAFLPRQFENIDSKQIEILKNFKPCLCHEDFKNCREISLSKKRGGVRFLARLMNLTRIGTSGHVEGQI